MKNSSSALCIAGVFLGTMRNYSLLLITVVVVQKLPEVIKKIKLFSLNIDSKSFMNDNFFKNVYEVVKLIPKGRVSSYGLIAQYLGMKSGARMVGWAMNSAHGLSDVPAHRVVNAQGLLTGKMHFEHPNKMQELLEKEGLSVKNDKIDRFKEIVWNPTEELL